MSFFIYLSFVLNGFGFDWRRRILLLFALLFWTQSIVESVVVVVYERTEGLG